MTVTWFLLYGGLGVVVLGYVGWKVAPRSFKRSLLMRIMFAGDGGPTPKDRKGFEESVLVHGPLERLSSNLWRVSGTLPQPGPKFNRNFTIFRVPGSDELILHSVVCLREDVKREMEKLGKVAYIIIPNTMHRIDAFAYMKEYPGAKFITPAASLGRNRAWVDEIFSTCEAFFDSRPEIGVKYLEPQGAGKEVGELIYLFPMEEDDTSAMVCTDLFFNLDPQKSDTVTKMIGSAIGFGVTSIGKIMMENPTTFSKFINDHLLNQNISIVVVGHGDIITGVDTVNRKLKTASEKLLE